MAQVYRYNQNISQKFLNQLKSLKGDYGSTLNPILDNTGKYCLSVEEWNAIEFQKYKGTLLNSSEVSLVTYEPIPSTRILPGDP